MPRKRWKYKLTSHQVSLIDPDDRHANSDEELVRHALVDFDELAAMSDEVRNRLIIELVDAVRFARAGIETGKVGVSNKAVSQQIFLADVGRAMKRAGLHPTRWRKRYDNGGGESLYFRIAREIAGVSGLGALPKDTKLLGQLASKYRYGGGTASGTGGA
jgi:hypothetical protein